MNIKKFLAIGVIIVIVGAIVVFAGTRPASDIEPTFENETETVLSRLPYSIIVGDRTVVLDTTEVPLTQQDKFSVLDLDFLPQLEPGEDPIDYVERILNIGLTQENIMDEPDFYESEVSFYVTDDRIISAFLRLNNIPDDSIGATEERLDFLFIDGEWKLEWYGLRYYCRRMDQEYWAPADELCP